MSFGWSAGDIFAAVRFILQVASALDEVDGAANDFREASSFLKTLSAALTPLEAFTALDSKPAYKNDIEREVGAIKGPIEKFIEDVKDMQKSLGVPQEGHFRHLRNIPSKLKWHFFTSKKALSLQKGVENHLKVIEMLMSRLTVYGIPLSCFAMQESHQLTRCNRDIVHTLPADIKGGIQESFEEKLNVHFPAFQATLLAELARRDYTMQAAWKDELMNLLETFLGSQRINLSSSPAPGALAPVSASPAITPTMLKANAAYLESRYQLDLLKNCEYPIMGITADSEVTSHLESWWTAAGSEFLWVQTSPLAMGERPLASDMVALSRAASLLPAVYFCQRSNRDGAAPRQMDIFIDLVYSLIYQLCISITEEVSCQLDLSASRFTALDGTVRSILEALDLLRDLLPLRPGRTLLLIDGLEILDFSNDSVLEEHLKMLFEILRSRDNDVMIKTLITTQGHSGAVLDEVGWECTVDASMSSSADGFFSLTDFEQGMENTKFL
jgi:hypothetical protein